MFSVKHWSDLWVFFGKLEWRILGNRITDTAESSSKEIAFQRDSLSFLLVLCNPSLQTLNKTIASKLLHFEDSSRRVFSSVFPPLPLCPDLLRHIFVFPPLLYRPPLYYGCQSGTLICPQISHYTLGARRRRHVIETKEEGKNGPHGGKAQKAWMEARSSAEAPVWCPRAGNSDLVLRWHVYGWWAQASDCSLAPGPSDFTALGRRVEQTRRDSTRLEPGIDPPPIPSCQSSCHLRLHVSIITSATFLAMLAARRGNTGLSASEIIKMANYIRALSLKLCNYFFPLYIVIQQ